MPHSRNAFPAEVENIVFETDVPEIVLARDAFDSAYLCALVERQHDRHFYVAVAISNHRMAAFRQGEIDLRTVLAEPEILPHFTARLKPDATKATLFLEATDLDLDWLPEPGFLLSDFEAVTNEDVVTESLHQNTAVVTYRLNPPEARGTIARINASRLSEWLDKMQTLVSHSTRLALKQMNTQMSAAQLAGIASVLQVFAMSSGSFKVHLAAEDGADLIGRTQAGAGLHKIDELMSLMDLPPEEAFRRLEKNKGHTLSAFQSLLELVATQESDLEYRWAEPGMGEAGGRRVSPVAAQAMVAILKTTTTLKMERLSFIGHFTAVNTDKEPLSWRAFDTTNERKRSGRLHEETPGALNGITVRDVLYNFTCEERLEQSASGTSKPVVFLRSAEKLTK